MVLHMQLVSRMYHNVVIYETKDIYWIYKIFNSKFFLEITLPFQLQLIEETRHPLGACEIYKLDMHAQAGITSDGATKYHERTLTFTVRALILFRVTTSVTRNSELLL